jgi:hypothetical protein
MIDLLLAGIAADPFARALGESCARVFKGTALRLDGAGLIKIAAVILGKSPQSREIMEDHLMCYDCHQAPFP